MSEKNKSNKIYITRLYDAPVKMVWEAWADPQQAAKWWGPRGFTITTHSKDLKPGGIWHYTMHGPDGTDYPNKTLYHEVETYAKLAYDHGGNDEQAPLFKVIVFFRELANQKTQMDMTMELRSAEEAEKTRQFIKAAGGNATWDRLAEYLEKQKTGAEIFVINRSFPAPVEDLFAFWAEPKHFSKWLGPVGWAMEFVRADVREGGSSFYVMHGPDTMKMYGLIEYEKVTAPKKLIYRQRFCDENEKPARHIFDKNWPDVMETTVELSAEGEKDTRVTVTWRLIDSVTPIEKETFIKGRDGMTQGWGGSFDKLDEYLEKKK